MKVLKNTIIITFVATIFIIAACSSDKSKYVIPQQYQLTEQLKQGFSTDSLSSIASALRADNSVHFNELYADAIMAWCMCYQRNDDSTYYYASKAISEIGVLPDTTFAHKRLMSDMELISGFSLIVAQPESATEHINNSIRYSNQIGAVRSIVKAYLYLSEINKNRGDFMASLQYLNTIQEICDTLPTLYSNTSWILEVLSDIAGLGTEIGDERLVTISIQTASFYYDNASVNSRIYYLYHRVRSHFYADQYSLAIFNAQRLENMIESNGNYDMLSWTYVMHGLALSRVNELEEAELYRDKADSVIRKYKLQPIKEKRMLDGEIAAMQGKSDEAYHILFDSIQTDHRRFDYKSLLESRKRYYQSINDYKTIYKLQKRQNWYLDSLQANVIFNNVNTRMTSEHNNANKMREELAACSVNTKQMRTNRTYERIAIMAVVLLSILIIFIHTYRDKLKYQEKVEKEKDKLREELSSMIIDVKSTEDMLKLASKRLQESISYAEHIQRSILPKPETLEMCNITGSFIFFSPLDIVSGDFYWFNQIGDHLIVCCADCTGHGIPGAFMSMIASTIISDICKRSPEDISPAAILEQLDADLVVELGRNQSADGASKDGCDISILSLNTKTKEAVVASARRPVIIIKDQEMIEVKGVKRSIGDTELSISHKPFVDTTFQLHENDTIYMFSDGYTDQFGGHDNSRLNLTNTKRFLRAIHNDDMDEQGLTMQEFFTQWKGDYPQTDDVLFIGIMI